MERYFGAPVREEAYEAGKSKARTQLANALDRSRRKIESLERQLIDQEALETLRKQGELILAYGATFSAGQTVLRTQYDPDGPDLIIELDPALSPSENARRYFDRYEKAKRAGKGIPALLKKARYEAAFLDQLSADLDMAENWPDIQAVREIMQKEGYWSGGHAGSPRGGKAGVRRFVSPDGFVVLVGRNAVQNHALITEQAGPADLWLHARNIPGSHVIIRVDGRPVPDPVIGWAAGLAAYYSTGRGEATVEVVVTERRYVRPVKGGGPGLVRYKNEKTLQVKPLRPEKRTS
jgi:predicted ribosome quality control (RQC) complex YloA/Tae2 family protein